MCAKSLQSRLTLYDPVDYSPPDSSVHGIFQAGVLEWVAMPFLQRIFHIKGSNTCLYISCTGRWVSNH